MTRDGFSELIQRTVSVDGDEDFPEAAYIENTLAGNSKGRNI